MRVTRVERKACGATAKQKQDPRAGCDPRRATLRYLQLWVPEQPP